jgi:hypothetical protein
MVTESNRHRHFRNVDTSDLGYLRLCLRVLHRLSLNGIKLRNLKSRDTPIQLRYHPRRSQSLTTNSIDLDYVHQYLTSTKIYTFHYDSSPTVGNYSRTVHAIPGLREDYLKSVVLIIQRRVAVAECVWGATQARAESLLKTHSHKLSFLPPGIEWESGT